MVGIAQLVERLVVVQDVAGSSPVTHPNCPRENKDSNHPKEQTNGSLFVRVNVEILPES